MVFTEIKIDNICSFSRTVFDFTYKTKPSYSSVDFEYLEEAENYKYKKVCILSGANATGKTSIGRILHMLQSYIVNGNISVFEDPDRLPKMISNKRKRASIEAQFIQKDFRGVYHHYLNIVFDVNGIVNMKRVQIPIFKSDSNLTIARKLASVLADPEKGYSKAIYDENPSGSIKMEKIISGWYYELATNMENRDMLDRDDISTNILLNILQCFDSSIKNVVISDHSNDDTREFNGYIIQFHNGDPIHINKKGESVDIDRLSKGTYDAIKTALFTARIMKDNERDDPWGNIYFLDEKLAYAHSTLEQAIINLIIEKLPKFSQFFYTTHNYDILELDLPAHSFMFLRKDHNNNATSLIDPMDFNIKNDRKIIHMIKKDVFGISPHADSINKLLWE